MRQPFFNDYLHNIAKYIQALLSLDKYLLIFSPEVSSICILFLRHTLDPYYDIPLCYTST